MRARCTSFATQVAFFSGCAARRSAMSGAQKLSQDVCYPQYEAALKCELGVGGVRCACGKRRALSRSDCSRDMPQHAPPKQRRPGRQRLQQGGVPARVRRLQGLPRRPGALLCVCSCVCALAVRSVRCRLCTRTCVRARRGVSSNSCDTCHPLSRLQNRCGREGRVRADGRREGNGAEIRARRQ